MAARTRQEHAQLHRECTVNGTSTPPPPRRRRGKPRPAPHRPRRLPDACPTTQSGGTGRGSHSDRCPPRIRTRRRPLRGRKQRVTAEQKTADSARTQLAQQIGRTLGLVEDDSPPAPAA